MRIKLIKGSKMTKEKSNFDLRITKCVHFLLVSAEFK